MNLIYQSLDTLWASDLHGSQLGPLSFALANVFNDTPDDRTESFQFEIGTQF